MFFINLLTNTVLFICLAISIALSPCYALAGQAVRPAVAVPSTDMGTGSNIIHLSPPDETRGALDIRMEPTVGEMEPPAELLLTDPDGRRLGLDPRTGASYKDIPGSFYEREGLDDDETGEPGPATCVMDIMNPLPGEYTLEAIGSADGTYIIEVNGYGEDYKDTSHAEFLDVKTGKGVVHEYGLTYSNRPGEKTKVLRRGIVGRDAPGATQ